MRGHKSEVKGQSMGDETCQIRAWEVRGARACCAVRGSLGHQDDCNSAESRVTRALSGSGCEANSYTFGMQLGTGANTRSARAFSRSAEILALVSTGSGRADAFLLALAKRVESVPSALVGWRRGGDSFAGL